jgi:hypothetical protein
MLIDGRAYARWAELITSAPAVRPVISQRTLG